MSLRNIIITGATGKQGGATLASLLAHPAASTKPFHIFAVTRDKNSRGAQALAAKPNVSIVQGNLENPTAIFKQVPNPWGVFSVQLPLPSAAVEEKQGKALADAAADVGVKFFMYASVERGGPEQSDADPTEVAHFASKFRIEEHLKSVAKASPQRMQWSIIRPVAFMDNLTPDFLGKAFATMWRQVGEKKLQVVSTHDIGVVAAEAFLNPDEYAGKAISLAGDELTQAEAAKIFKDELGRDMPTTFDLVARGIKVVLREQLGTMFQWFGEKGFGADLEGLRKKYPHLQDFRTWLKQSSAFR